LIPFGRYATLNLAMDRILLIEDSDEVKVLVRRTLGANYQLQMASSAAQGLEFARLQSFDLLIVDVMLPDRTGFELCAQIRKTDTYQDVPLIFLTSLSDIKDKLMGFSLGADDYIVKPFEPLELRARVEAKLRSRHLRQQQRQFLTRGNLRIHLPFQKAFVVDANGEKELGLTSTEFRLLYYLAENEGVILSREQLLEKIWGDTTVLDRTVDTHIYMLRRKLPDEAQYIESVQGSGYRFVCRGEPGP
jgi:DNA-binding response OmpR family regulator